jgi:amidohydrolase
VTSEPREPESPAPDTLEPFLDEFLDAHLEELIAFRRQLHMRPELSGEEHETTALVASRLQIAGLEPRVLTRGTGLLCDVDTGTSTGPVVALRADLDALAMHDDKDVPYRSQVDGVAHACGHDAHTTVVLGAGLALARLAREQQGLPGRVRLVFQPAEESARGGARDVIADGGLVDVGACFGYHCDPRLDRGTIGVRPGAITSAADLVEITLHGPGGHTARPEQTVDIVAVAARVVSELPALLRERVGDLNLVFGAIGAGDAANVIPTTAVLRGTVRSRDRDAWARAPEALVAALDELVGPTGANVELDHERGVPPVVNDPAMTEAFADAARSVVGTEHVVTMEQSAGADDFAWYLEQVPGSYVRLGVHDPASAGPRLDLHAGTFDVDEGAIEDGIRVLVTATVGTFALMARTRTESPR